jgi:hypothetical protein
VLNETVTYGATIRNRVTIGGNLYTSAHPMKVLEIVPDQCLDEIGYSMGKDSGAVQWTDITMLPEKTGEQLANKRAVRNKWVDVVTTAIGGSNYAHLQFKRENAEDKDENWFTYNQTQQPDINFTEEDYDDCNIRVQYQHTDENGVTSWNNYVYNEEDGSTVYPDNILAYHIFGGYDMCDKMQLDIKTPDEVTLENIKDYDLIYINNGNHVGTDALSLYTLMYSACKNIAGYTDKYHDVSTLITQNPSGSNNYIKNKKDLTPQVAWQLYYSACTKQCSLVMDKNSVVALQASNYNDFNIGKLFILSCGIDRNAFIEDYASNYNEATKYYSGNRGKIDTQTMNIYCTERRDLYGNVRPVDTPLSWTSEMFAYSPYNQGPNDKYFNATAWGDSYNGPYLNQNIYIYNGDNTMGVDMITGSTCLFGNGKYPVGTTSKQAVSMYGDLDTGTIKCGQALRYVVGGYAEYREVTHINALEIEPAADYKYNNWEGAQKIAKYLGVSFADMDSSNYEQYIDITSVSVNEFIGMTDDIYTKYDIILFLDHNEASEYIKTNNINVYSYHGEVMKLPTTDKVSNPYSTLSGNDLTQKALNKIIAYIKKGKPFVIAPSIYNAASTFVDASDQLETNVYMLSKKKLSSVGIDIPSANILCEPTTDSESFTKLDYCFAPDLKIDNQFYCTYKNGIAVATFNASDLSSFDFSGNIGTLANMEYRLDIYLDKDGNGLYTSSNDEDNELYWNRNVTTGNDGTFSVNMTLPNGIRGYVRWKAVVTDIKSGFSAEQTGAIVIEFSQSEMKSVNVLQVVPGSSTSSSTLKMDGSSFHNLFSAASKVTGYTLNVKSVTVSDFEKWYNGITYTAGTSDYENKKLNKLAPYSMVVFGFGDDFNGSDIKNTSALNNIQDYINKGNSVLFSHDTMLYSSYSDGTLHNVQYKKTNSYVLTSRFRDIVGMDRYSASVNNSKLKYQQGLTNLFMMRYGQFYQNGKYQDYEMYGGMDDGLAGSSSLLTTNTVTKLNEGQITEYPYSIPQTLTVATTHAQWFQLDLESQGGSGANDVVVWYTLAKDPTEIDLTRGSFSKSGNYANASTTAKLSSGKNATGQIPVAGDYIRYDAVENGTLEITAKLPKNTKLDIVSDTGVIHSVTGERWGTSDKTLYVDVTKGHTYYAYTEQHATSIKQVSFVASGAYGNSQTWHADNLIASPKSTFYGFSGQDALNNYYIYSKGNVTYSGAGHSDINGSDELKLFVNTVVKAIASGNNAPVVKMNNAVGLGDNTYEKYIRTGDNGTYQFDQIDFTITDADMGMSEYASFKSGFVFWDVDNNGIYNDDSSKGPVDIILMTYNDENKLYNMVENSVPLDQYFDRTYTYKQDGKNVSTTLQNMLENNTLQLGVMVYDSHEQPGQATIHVINRDLFKLD